MCFLCRFLRRFLRRFCDFTRNARHGTLEDARRGALSNRHRSDHWLMTMLAVLGLEFCCLAAGFLLSSYGNITRRGRFGLAIVVLASTAAVVWMSTVGPISHGGVVCSPGEALLAMVLLLIAPIFPPFFTLLFRVKMAPVTGRMAADGKQLRQSGISLLESVLWHGC